MSPTTRKVVLAASPLLLFAVSADALDWQAAPLSGTVNLTSGFQPDPYQHRVTAGGDSPASRAGSNCEGYINASNPDLDLNYQAGQYPLSIYVTSSADTTLVVYDAAGNWHCNDDHSSSSGNNPALEWQAPPSGNYNIWVGTFSSDELPDARVFFTEGSPQWDRRSEVTQAATGAIQWGDDTSQWSHDDECDDPRFGGPGTDTRNLAEDRYHDATDCRRLHELGQIYLKPSG